MNEERIRELAAGVIGHYADLSPGCNIEADIADAIREAVAEKGWKLIATAPTDERIRVIGAKVGFVIGDLFYGQATMQLGRLGDDEYVKERCQFAWRYTEGENQVLPHMQPTHWIDLPDAPEE